MKKKAIEKIPYFGLKKTSRKKDVKYIGVTAVKIVGHEKHLFLEVYRNKKESKEIPMVRIVLTKKDFGTYWPEKEEWTRKKIKPDSCYGRVIWGEEHPTWEQEKKENILQSTEDLERIKKFCKANVYNEEHWWEYIYKHEDDIVITASAEELQMRDGKAEFPTKASFRDGRKNRERGTMAPVQCAERVESTSAREK